MREVKDGPGRALGPCCHTCISVMTGRQTRVRSAGGVARGGVDSKARELVLENGAANVHRVGALRNNDALCNQSETGGWEKKKREQE